MWDDKRAYIDMLVAVIFFSIMHVTVKYLARIPFYELVFFRALVSLMICFAMLKHKKLSPWGVNKRDLILRGVFGTVALHMYFYSLQALPLATAVSIQYLAPIFTAIAALIILKERVYMRQWLLFAVAFLGVLLVKGWDSTIPFYQLAIAVSAAFISGFAYTFVRKLGKTDDPLVVVFYFPLVTLPIVTPYLVTHWVTPTWSEWPLVIAIGVVTQIAQIYLTKSLHKEAAAKVSLVNYLGLVFAVVVGYFLFDELVGLRALLGMLLMVGSVYLGIFHKKSAKV